jgi:hypothetical protein
VSFDVRVYFRDDGDGYQWAEVAFLDRGADHAIVDQMPLVGDGVVSWFFGQIEERAFRMAAREKRSVTTLHALGQGKKATGKPGRQSGVKRKAA